MNGPVGDYFDDVCHIRGAAMVYVFPNELAMERFVVRCKHAETVIAKNGQQFCTRCWAMPRKKVGA